MNGGLPMILAVTGLSRRITELGYLVGGLGALIIAYGAYRVIRGSQERHRERGVTLIGALLIGAAFLLQLIGLVSAPKAAGPSPSPTVSVKPTRSPSR
jgi:hypothetical protein